MIAKRYLKWFSVLFVVVSLFIVIVLEIFTRTVLSSKNSVEIQYEMLLSKKNIKLLGIGDSHMARALNLDKDTFFNFSLPGENSVIMYMKLKKVLESGLRPDMVLLSADYHQFTDYRIDNIKYNAYEKYIDENLSSMATLQQINIKDDKKSFLYKMGLQQFKSDIAPGIFRALYQYISNPIQNNSEKSFTEHGAILSYGSDNISDSIILQRMAEQKLNQKSKILNRKLQYFYEESINLCQQYGIRPLLIRFPVTKRYLYFIDIDIRKQIDAYYKYLTDRYSVEEMDYSEFIRENKYFEDQDHLNADGARIFSEALVNHLGNLYGF